MMKINFYLIFAAVCISTSYTMHATQASLEQPQREATPLELQMIKQASMGRLTPQDLKEYLKQGADINANSNIGATALILAAKNDHPDIVRQLIAAGADVNAKTNIGATALIWAALNGFTGIVQQLIAAGVDLNAKDNEGKTALMYAHRRMDVVKQLIAAGADDTLRNEKDNNKTARDYVGGTITARSDPDYRNNSIIAYDEAVAAGLKKRADYLTRQAEAQRMLEEQEQLIPNVSDIIRDYAFSRSSQDLPEEEKKTAESTSSALCSKK